MAPAAGFFGAGPPCLRPPPQGWCIPRQVSCGDLLAAGVASDHLLSGTKV